MKIIKMPVSELNAQNLFDYIKALLAKLVANVADFPAPPGALTTSQGLLSTGLNELATIEAELTAKRLQVDVLAGTVRTDANGLGDWAETITTDPVKLAKVFDLRSARTPTGPTPQVMNLTLTRGDAAGEVDGHFDSLGNQGVKSYEVQTCLNPLNNDPIVGPWTQQPTVTKSKFTVAGFASGARIWVRVRAIGPSGPGAWSDPATLIVP